jgi:hypothetical protein
VSPCPHPYPFTTINHQQLRESLGEAGTAIVVNEGSIDEVVAQVQAALAPTILKSQPGAAAAPPPARAAAAAAAPRVSKETAAVDDEEEQVPLMFGGLLLTGSPARALRRAGIRQPTEVQEVALPKIKRGASAWTLEW